MVGFWDGTPKVWFSSNEYNVKIVESRRKSDKAN